jgi:hypothetical protein
MVTHPCAGDQRVRPQWYRQHSCLGESNIEPRRILIVQDNDDLRESLATWLALDGAVVDQAHSVATARAAQ